MRRFQVGERASLTRTITEDDVIAFARLTGDTNPLHLDEAYARTTRFGRRIAHGLLTAGLISALLGTELPGPGAIYLEQRLRFTRPVYLGDTVTATVEVLSFREEKGVLTLRTDCFNQEGEPVLTGEAVLLVRSEAV
ncbi:MAG: MaoC family dehydratase [Chloroflexi bacterium]|nr:MAG: MaoC family dehydratase [Chloroflexota bacterium]